MKTLTAIAIAWFVVLGLMFLFGTPLNNALFFIFPFFEWGMLLAGAVILVASLVACRKRFSTWGPALVIAVVGLVLYYSVGYRIGRLVWFQIRKPVYEELLVEAKRLGDVPSGSGYYDAGPPARYAFYWWRGVTDNWAGVVHDPSGDVMRVNEDGGVENLREGKYSELSAMFGGTFYRCEHLQGDWYLCWFT